jgi:hypothetical protein
MKLMSWMIIAICCVLAFTPVSAQQQRDRGDRGDRARSGDTTIIHNYGRPGGGYGRGGGRRYYSERRPGWRYESGRGWYDPSVAIGSAIGSYLWRQWRQPEPPPEPVRDAAWCAQRYKSYDWYTKTYLGYDGLRHGCP